MIEAQYVTMDETMQWLDDEPQVLELLSIAYRECVPTILNPITMDPRFLGCDHIVNVGFEENPVFIIAFIPASRAIGPSSIPVLYVFEEYRNYGIAKVVLESLLNRVNGIVAVAIEEEKAYLGSFYEKLGFVTLNRVIKDDLGTPFIDYFWGPRPIKLFPSEKGTLVSYADPVAH